MSSKLHESLDTFLRHIDSIKDTIPMALLLIEPYNKRAIDEFFDFIKSNSEEHTGEDGIKKYSLKSSELKKFELLEKNASISILANKIIIEGLFVSLISQYDAFLTRLLRIIYEIKPGIVNDSERNLTFSQLSEFGTIEKAKDFIIEKEVDTVLRMSHIEQFDYLEKRIGIKLRENLPAWKTFIEITERRNILVHNDGIVSNQYINVCLKHDCIKSDTVSGKKLEVSLEYFRAAYECLYEISVKLTHTLWRKLLPKDLEDADDLLNNVCFNLINSKSYKLADILLDFGYSQKHHSNEIRTNMFIINKALSSYLQGNKELCLQTLDKKDWTASSDDFRLANFILREDYLMSYELMKRIGVDGEIITKDSYKEWPLFITIRNKKAFKQTFKEIFNEDYSISEIPERPLQELLKKTKNKKTK